MQITRRVLIPTISPLLKKIQSTTILVIILTTACASVTAPSTQRIQVDKEAYIKLGDGEVKLVKKNTESEIPFTDPILIEAPGHTSVLLVPSSTGANVKVQLKPLSQWGGKSLEIHSSQILSQIMSEIIEIQISLGKNLPNEALEKVKKLRQKYPNVTYLKFIESSCLAVLGKKTEALSLLETALKEYPTDEPARKLYRSLAGKEFPEP